MLDVTELRAGYGPIPVLHGISFQVADGEAVGILGHNGMGKTTLLRTIVGALRATHGSVLLGGEDITRLPTHSRARLGLAYVPQGREIFPTLSVLDNLNMGAVRQGPSKAEVLDTLLEDFPRLKPLLQRPGGQLSGGEQQLLALARALAGKPRVLLLDEPTEGIQPSIIEEIAETLVRLRAKTGLSIVLVEQNLEFIVSVSERVLVIKRGKISAEIPHEHLGDPQLMNEHAGVHL